MSNNIVFFYNIDYFSYVSGCICCFWGVKSCRSQKIPRKPSHAFFPRSPPTNEFAEPLCEVIKTRSNSVLEARRHDTHACYQQKQSIIVSDGNLQLCQPKVKHNLRLDIESPALTVLVTNKKNPEIMSKLKTDCFHSTEAKGVQSGLRSIYNSTINV